MLNRVAYQQRLAYRLGLTLFCFQLCIAGFAYYKTKNVILLCTVLGQVLLSVLYVNLCCNTILCNLLCNRHVWVLLQKRCKHGPLNNYPMGITFAA